MPQKLLLILAVAICVGAASGQQKPADDTGKLEKEAIDLLRETSLEVGRLRTLENRISFNSELASLMWFHDDKEARVMYGAVVGEFKQLLSQFDAAMNAVEQPEEDEYSGGLFGSYGRSMVQKKFQTAMAVRKQIAMSLAEHAPDLAYNFYFDSINAITNPAFRQQAESSDSYFEGQLMEKIAASDAAKAAEYGKESLRSGVDSRHISLLRKIYEKDVDKAIDYGAALLSKLRTEKTNAKGIYVFGELLSFAAANFEESKKPGAKKPIYELGDVRDIAELLARAVTDGDSMPYPAYNYLDKLEKYAPARAAQIKAKLDRAGVGNANLPMLRTANVGIGPGVSGNFAANANSASTREMEQRAAQEQRENELKEGIQAAANKELSKEERDKVIARARAIIATTPGKDKKLTSLCLLAAQTARAGDKELADEIMRDAERLVNPQPKNYRDFLMSAILAAGYAEVNPDKAFPLLESTILRANDTLSAFIKVAEFIDLNDEMIDDGEIQVGMFGGEMIRGITGELGLASSTIRTLAKADFAKTKNLANTFDRAEIRVVAKMLVLRSVLEKKDPEKPEDDILKEFSLIK